MQHKIENFESDKLNLGKTLIEIEQDQISKGIYQRYLDKFTIPLDGDKKVYTERLYGSLYHIYLLINECGFRCSLAIPASPQAPLLKIHLNFYGTIDFAAHINNFDLGGPGEEIIKKYQAQLMQKLNEIIEQIPEEKIWLRVAGHSQGGALAKQFIHILQKASALQRNTAQEIIQEIKVNLKSPFSKKTHSFLSLLHDNLEDESHQFKKLTGLTRIQGITLYAHGAPGVSHSIDSMATLMTYYHESNFLRIYHAFHKEDIFVKFGEVELFSGKNGIPRISINKAIIYDLEINEKHSKNEPLLPASDLLPIPLVTHHHMAAHRLKVYDEHSKISIRKEVICCEELEKFKFNLIERRVFRLFFTSLGFLASFDKIVELFPDLRSDPGYHIEKIYIEPRYFYKLNELGEELVKAIFLRLNEKDQRAFMLVNKKYYGLFKPIHSKIVELLNLIIKDDESGQDRIKAVLKENPKFILTAKGDIEVYGIPLKNASAFQLAVWKSDIKKIILLLECLKFLPGDKTRKFIQQELLKQLNEVRELNSNGATCYSDYLEGGGVLSFLSNYIYYFNISEEMSLWNWSHVKASFNRIPEHIRQNWDLQADLSSSEPQALELVKADYELISEFHQKSRKIFKSIKELLKAPIESFTTKLDEFSESFEKMKEGSVARII